MFSALVSYWILDIFHAARSQRRSVEESADCYFYDRRFYAGGSPALRACLSPAFAQRLLRTSMNFDVDLERLPVAEKAVRAELLAERSVGGCWTGRVSSSPVATAAAVSALVVSHHQDCDDLLREASKDDGGQMFQQLVQG